jgi:hypothetical protein
MRHAKAKHPDIPLTDYQHALVTQTQLTPVVRLPQRLRLWSRITRGAAGMVAFLACVLFLYGLYKFGIIRW